MAIRVDLTRQAFGTGGQPTAADVRYWVRAAAGAADIARGEIGVLLVDEPAGLALNQQWRGKGYATNVLSFPAGTSAAELGADQPHGDLVLCIPVVEREAHEQNKPLPHHWAHLLVHGTLHLFGYDHQQPEEAQEMESLETQLLGQRGIPDPYQQHDGFSVDDHETLRREFEHER